MKEVKTYSIRRMHNNGERHERIWMDVTFELSNTHPIDESVLDFIKKDAESLGFNTEDWRYVEFWDLYCKNREGCVSYGNDIKGPGVSYFIKIRKY